MKEIAIIKGIVTISLATLLVMVVMLASFRTAEAAPLTLYVVGTGSSDVSIAGDAGTTNLRSGNNTSLAASNSSYTTLLSRSSETNSNTRMQEVYDSSGNHILGRGYYTTGFTTPAIISRNTPIVGTFFLRSRSVSTPATNLNDNFIFRVVDYTPTAGQGAGTTIVTSGSVASPSTGSSTSVSVTFPALGSDYILPAGHYLGLEVQYVSGGASRTGYLYCNSGNQSRIVVPLKFNIDATAGSGGSITPSGNTQVDAYGSQSYSISADSGNQIQSLLVDGVSVPGAVGSTSYTYSGFTNVTASHTISVSFQQATGTFNVVPGTGGCISLDATPCLWPGGATYSYTDVIGTYLFTVTPNAGYGISQVLVDNADQGVPLGQTTTWSTNLTLTNNATRNIAASFLPYFTVTASVSGTGGTVDPPSSSVLETQAITITITPDSGYVIGSVTDNGVDVGSTSTTYTITNISGPHDIVATFLPSHHIIASSGSNGTISPIGDIVVGHGRSRNFSLNPNWGYKVSTVTIDGVPIDPVTTYTFSNVTVDHTISVTFEESPASSTYCAIPPFIATAPPPNVMLMLSVESPMQGPGNTSPVCIGTPSSINYTCNSSSGGCGNGALGCYDNSRDYSGYFDSGKCYSYSGSGSSGLFSPSATAINPTGTGYTPHQCTAGTAWSGNLLNWATTMAVDAFRKSFTGGNRAVDTTTSTVILAGFNSGSWFPDPIQVTNAEMYMPVSGTGQTRYLRRSGAGIGFVLCNSGQTTCSFSVSGSGEARFPVAGTNAQAAYSLRIKACDSTGGVEKRCNSSNNKPEGIIQKYMNKMRFALMSYAADNSQDRDGGVLRAPMKWVNPTIPYGMLYYNSSGVAVTCATASGCANPEAEIDVNGLFISNPAGATGANSGIVNYINKFAYASGYKSSDPMGELYYQVVRYFMNLTPSVNKYCSGLTSFTASSADGFAFYCDSNKTNTWGWRKPDLYHCSQNFAIAINDANPWLDKRVPGSAFKAAYGGSAASGTDYCGSSVGACDTDFTINGTPVDVEDWTNKIGDNEGFTGRTFNATNRQFGCEVDAAGACIGGFASSGKSITLSKLGRIIGTPPYQAKENSYNVAGLSYFAHMTDLRPDLATLYPTDPIHNLTTYMIDTQEPASNQLVGPMNMLYLAGKYGGFIDKAATGKPYNGATCGGVSATPDNKCSGWDADNDGMPDNYFYASNAAQVENSLNTAFDNMSNRASSGTAAAVANNKSGQRGANLVQALFYPQWKYDKNIRWLGEVQALWYYLDPVINFSGVYEDTDQNAELNLTIDVPPGDDPFFVNGIWKAGVNLHTRAASDRKIYSLLNTSTSDLTSVSNSFSTTNLTTLKPLLNVTSQTDTQAGNLINYLRGVDSGTYRSRTVTLNGTTAPWKLGDVIDSTPQVQSKIASNAYHTLYSDTSYATFIGSNQYLANNIVYAGANDGMLHAFKLGQVEKITDATKPFRIAGIVDETDMGKEQWAYIPNNVLPFMINTSDQNYCHQYLVDGAPVVVDASINKYSSCSGSNYWDCTRQSKLVGGTGPSKNDYVQATSSWKSVLIGSMGLGGATREDTCNETLNSDSNLANNSDCIKTPAANYGFSSYFSLDVTDQLLPRHMWEFSDASLSSADKKCGTSPNYTYCGLGLTTPGVSLLRINALSGSPAAPDRSKNGRWFAVFASGPTGTIETATRQFLGRSDQDLRIYVVDLNPFDTVSTWIKDTNYWIFDTGVKFGFANSMNGASLDLDRSASTVPGNYSDDVVYVTYTRASLDTSGFPVDWDKGGVLRLVTNNDPNPANWFVSTLIDNIGPITTSIGKLQDRNNKKLWIYFGEGRYFYQGDNQTNGRRIFGIADPCYSYDLDHINTLSTTASNCPAITVNTSGDPVNLKDQTSTPSAPLGTLDKGWFINLDGASGFNGSERVVSDVTASFNGIVFYTTFVPNSDPCVAGGTTSLWAVKYNTGGTPPSGGLKGKAPLQTSSGGISIVDLGTAFTQRGGRKLDSSLSPSGMAPKGRFPPLLQPKPSKQILNIQER